jgi:hypothetical protein
MRVIFSISLLFTLLFSQARVGEMQSITSSLDVQTLIASEDEIILATRGGLAFYNINSGTWSTGNLNIADENLCSKNQNMDFHTLYKLKETSILRVFDIFIKDPSAKISATRKACVPSAENQTPCFLFSNGVSIQDRNIDINSPEGSLPK